jgi:hypothetical protein
MVFRSSFVAMKNACCAANSQPVIDYDNVVLTDPATGNPVMVVVTGNPPVSTAFNLDGTPYVGPISALKPADDFDYDSDPHPFCDGVTSFLRWYVTKNGQPTGTVFDTSMAGAPYVASPVVTPGVCVPQQVAPTKQTRGTAQNLAGGSYVPDFPGSTTTWIPADAQLAITTLQSVTVTAIAIDDPTGGDSITVSFGAGGVNGIVTLVAGQSMTWSVSQDNFDEFLDPEIEVVVLGNAHGSVNWTENL